MTDYQCPECDCGFPESAGKTTIDPREVESDRSLFERLMQAFEGRHYYVIQCPNCRYIFGDESFDGDLAAKLGLEEPIESYLDGDAEQLKSQIERE